MTGHNGDRFVSQKQFYTTIGSTILGVLSLGWIGWQVHASQPHSGTVSHREHDAFRQTVTSQLDRIEDKIDSMYGRD